MNLPELIMQVDTQAGRQQLYVNPDTMHSADLTTRNAWQFYNDGIRHRLTLHGQGRYSDITPDTADLPTPLIILLMKATRLADAAARFANGEIPPQDIAVGTRVQIRPGMDELFRSQGFSEDLNNAYADGVTLTGTVQDIWHGDNDELVTSYDIHTDYDGGDWNFDPDLVELIQ